MSLFGQSSATEIYDVLDPFYWFFCESSSSCTLKVFSEVLDTNPFVQKIICWIPTASWALYLRLKPQRWIRHTPFLVLVGDDYTIMVHRNMPEAPWGLIGRRPGNDSKDLPEEGILTRGRYTCHLDLGKEKEGVCDKCFAMGALGVCCRASSPAWNILGGCLEKDPQRVGGKYGIGESSRKAEQRARSQRWFH